MTLTNLELYNLIGGLGCGLALAMLLALFIYQNADNHRPQPRMILWVIVMLMALGITVCTGGCIMDHTFNPHSLNNRGVR